MTKNYTPPVPSPDPGVNLPFYKTDDVCNLGSYPEKTDHDGFPDNSTEQVEDGGWGVMSHFLGV